jgi:NitT/TauT family transport system permease protein
MTTLDPRWKWIRQLVAFAVLLVLWEAAGRAGLLNPLFVPSPSLIGSALYELFADGRIWPHLDATFTAALLGLALGILAGIVLGVVAALLPPVAELLEPVMTLLNAIPRVVLAPLFVIWLGIDLASKVALAFILVAVVIFFTVFNGIRQVDRKLVERIVTLGGGRWDLVARHRGFDRLIFGHFRMGKSSGATSSSMLRGTPGWRRIIPARSRVRTIW